MGESATFLVFLAETCISHSRTTVGAALSSAKRTSGRRRRPEGPGGSAPRPEGSPGCLSRPPPNRPPPPARGPGGAGCPNLLQRPGSRRSVREETLVFRASSRGRSCRGGPLQQIRTRLRPGPSQEPHAPHSVFAPASSASPNPLLDLGPCARPAPLPAPSRTCPHHPPPAACCTLCQGARQRADSRRAPTSEESLV